MKKYEFQKQPGIAVHQNVLLKDYTTFQLGGPCPEMITCMRPKHLAAVVQELAIRGQSFLFLGGGSNVVISDWGWPEMCVCYRSSTPCIEPHGDILHVPGSTSLDGLAHFCAVMGMEGMTFATGIPGTVGGAISGNAGAFGEQIADRLEAVDLMDRAGQIRQATPDELGFDYRTSALQGSEEMVVAARIRVCPGTDESLLKERERILALRADKHPNWPTEPCAGSVFRNLSSPEPGAQRQAAGWLLEQAGVKEMRCGGVCVYEKHANIIIKDREDGTAQNVFDLVQKMRAAVWTEFQIELVPEIQFLGKMDEYGVEETEI